jgi:alkylation response protein AidB-like acyl-CoA dehydrogenase
MTQASRLFDPALAASLEVSVPIGPPARRMQERLTRLHEPGMLFAPDSLASRDVRALARTLATVASADMSLAFSLWCHRMVIEYLRAADEASAARRWLPRLETGATFGSTALAAAMAHHVSGAPLPIKGREVEAGHALDGRVRWASNLFNDEFLLVTAVERPGREPLVVALTAEQDGLEIDPYPELLDLQETSSSSLRLTDVRVGADAIVSTHFDRFIRGVRPVFLLAQASFCWGLAARSLTEAAGHVGRGANEVFAPALRELENERDRLHDEIADGIDAAATIAPVHDMRPIVGSRLSAARLAEAATRFESKVVGGAGYARASATARRLREAAFLPIQSPTEGQLLWELSRSR